MNLLRTFNITPHFKTPSRITNNSATCIKNILIDNKSQILIQETLNWHLGDHLVQKYVVPYKQLSETKKNILKQE